MAGFPKLGIIGLGNRGIGHLKLFLDMDDIKVSAVCDVFEDRVQKALDIIFNKSGEKPECYTDYNELLASGNVDFVIVVTSWTTHIEIGIAALKAGKICGLEVGGASSVDECWDLVKAYEATKTPFMFLENCCYGREEMMILNMVKQNVFGELIHCQCGYEHDIRDEVGLGKQNRHYRLDNYMNRNGEIYPTHGLGPAAMFLDINRGNRMVSLTSMSSKARGMHEWIGANAGKYEKNDPLLNYHFNQGDIVTTMIKCAHGETIFLIHDTTLPRPYSRGGRVQGTKGLWMEDNRSIYIEGVSPAHKWESFDKYVPEYEHPLWKWFVNDGVRGGHGGMDYLLMRALVESIMEGKPMPIDVYDGAAWMAVTALSEQSVALGSAPLCIPDFTNGKWLTYKHQKPTRYSLDGISAE